MSLDKNKHKISRVPVVMQLEAVECGAACLAMILAYYKKWVPLEQLRKDCGVSRDGVNALNIVEAAELYNLESEGSLYEIDEIKKEATFPCIIHWNFDHFVVLKGFKHNRAYINDPESGQCSVSMEEFDKSFTGVCLEFKPTKEFQPSGQRKSILKFAKKRLKGATKALVFTGIVVGVGLIINFIFPVFQRVLVDNLLTNDDKLGMYIFLIAFGSLALIYLMIEFIDAIHSLRIKGRFAVNGTTTYMWKVLNLPIEFFSQRYANDIKSRKDTNATIANVLINIFIPIFLQSIVVIFYLIVMFNYSWLLSLIGLSALVVDMLAAYLVSQKRINLSRAAVRDKAKLDSTTVSGISMIETIKAGGTENGLFTNWAGYQANYNNREVKLIKFNNGLTAFLDFASTFADTAIILVGIILIMNNRLTIGLLMAFQGFMASFFAPAQSVVESGQELMEMRTEMERLDDVMEYQNDTIIGESDGKDYSNNKLTGNIKIANITFGYARLAPPLLKDFSLNIKKGESVAFVGNSGSGKSTLIKLIIGLHSPWQGSITFDNLLLKDIPKNRFSTSVSIVSQEIKLFEDTIMNNVKMFNSNVSNEDVIRGCKDAQIHEEIIKRENGYNSILSEDGRNLSGGQRQRLELARVLASNPGIIVLDEATSALDAKTEFNVIKAIKKRGLTNLIVAHRLSTIRSCDKIVVLQKGKILDQGKHEELIKRCPYYKKLVINE